MSVTRQRPLLCFHHGALGDFVMTFPALAHLKDRFGGLSLVCPAAHGRLAAALGLVEHWHPAEAAVWSSLYAGTADARVQQVLSDTDAIVLFSNSEDLARGVRAFSDAAVYRVPPLPPAAARIAVHRYLRDGLASCGLLAAGSAGSPLAPLPAEPPGLPPAAEGCGDVLIHPGAGSRRKRWPLARFLAVAERLSRDGLQVRFLIGPAEEDLARPIAGRGGGKYPLLRCEGLVELAGRLRSVKALVGNDAGVSQLAGVLGVRTVVVFGPADPVRWMPLGPSVTALRPAVDCEPCFETRRENCDGARPRCLMETGPTEVLGALYALLENRG